MVVGKKFALPVNNNATSKLLKKFYRFFTGKLPVKSPPYLVRQHSSSSQLAFFILPCNGPNTLARMCLHVYGRARAVSRIISQQEPRPRHNPYFGRPWAACTVSSLAASINFYVTSPHKFRFSDEGHLQRGERKEGPNGRWLYHWARRGQR